MDIRRIGVVGAGQMGNGIAHVMALAGYDVLLNDINAEALESAVARIDKNIARQVSKGAVSVDEHAQAMARISTTVELTQLGPCDLIIEAATEREEIKHKIFATLLPHLAEHTILTDPRHRNRSSHL